MIMAYMIWVNFNLGWPNIILLRLAIVVEVDEAIGKRHVDGAFMLSSLLLLFVYKTGAWFNFVSDY